MNARGKEVESVGQTTPDPAQDRRDAEKDCPFPFWSTKKKTKAGIQNAQPIHSKREQLLSSKFKKQKAGILKHDCLQYCFYQLETTPSLLTMP